MVQFHGGLKFNIFLLLKGVPVPWMRDVISIYVLVFVMGVFWCYGRWFKIFIYRYFFSQIPALIYIRKYVKLLGVV